MIAYFSQTYANNRQILFDTLYKDKYTQYWIQSCDFIVFSFHNSSEQFVEYNTQILKQIFKNKQIFFLNHKYITYTGSIRRSFKFIKEELKADYILFNQDDSFCTHLNFQDIDKIFQIYQNIPYLNLEYNIKNLHKNIEHTIFDQIKIYKSTTLDFLESDNWSFDDSCYIGNLHYIINEIFI